MENSRITFYFQISGPLLDESQVRSIVDEIKRVITASSTRKRERAERAKAEDFDAEEGELLKEEDEQEEEVFDQVCVKNSSFIISLMDVLGLITGTCLMVLSYSIDTLHSSNSLFSPHKWYVLNVGW